MKKNISKRLTTYLNLTLCWSLFFVDISSIYAQAKNVTVDTTQENQASQTKQSHEENDAKHGLTTNTSKCETPTSGLEDNRQAESEYRKNLMEQGFSQIDNIFTDVETKRAQLDSNSESLNSATGGIGLQEPGQSNNIEKQKALEKEQSELDGKISAKKNELQSIQSKINSITSRDHYLSANERSQLSLLRAEEFKVDSQLQQLLTRKVRIRAEIRRNALVDGRNSVANADKAVQGARAAATPQEAAYRALIAAIKSQEQKANESLALAEQRIADVQLESANNADFMIFEKAMMAPDESTDQGRSTISNLETLSMASAGMSNLKCVDFSRVKSRSYVLFKAATATYIANHLNNSSEYTRLAKECILKCISLEEISADQKRSANERQYPQFQDLKTEDATTNCITDDGRKGLFENDNVAADDEDEQFASIERMANLYNKLEEFTQRKVASQQQALKLFQAAHAAALMEVTSKNSLTAAAEAQLNKAKAEKKKAQSSINIYIAIIAILYAINSSCYGCQAAAIVAAIYLLNGYRKDLKKANKDIAKWKKELQETRIHTHMMCNYPGSAPTIDQLNNPDSVALIYPKSVIMQRVTAGLYKPSDRINLKFALSFPNLAELFFTNAHAAEINKGLGFHSQAGSFREYLTMKAGAWSLQTHNASLKVDLRKNPVTIDHLFPNQSMMNGTYSFISKNAPSSNGKLIEQSGFPLPETRLAYLSSVLKMFEKNIDNGATSLANVQRINKIYAELLNKARDHFGISKGVTDAAVTEDGRQPVCLTGNSAGVIAVDSSCACKNTNSCSRFVMPSFGSFAPGDLATNSKFIIDGINDFSQGNLNSGETNFNKITESSSAIGELKKRVLETKLAGNLNEDIEKFQNKSFKNTSASINKTKESSNSKNSSNVKNLNSLAANSSSTNIEDQKDAAENNSDNSKNSKKLNPNGDLVGLSSKKSSKSALNNKNSLASSLGKVNFDNMDETDTGDVDLDLLEKERRQLQLNNSSSQNQYSSSNSGGSYTGQDGQVYTKEEGISLDSKIGIFKQISKRYRYSAMPILLKKKKKESIDGL
ncbi:hypothetical protein [Halobacteriovorax sp. HLS]|uniref:hypothetical protein n=1 Tax=Halobacteriovorax sp. HLS TaxID=2234000 RepID=UPI000FD81CC7|nr:hypothetical protein [Halobacteriovorax sp. HLS]